MTLAQKAAKLLAGLGDTPEEIRAMLVGAGYKGMRWKADECPCGACLRDHLGETVYIYPLACGDTRDSKGTAFNAPQVSQFIGNFDAGEYPELVLVAG